MTKTWFDRLFINEGYKTPAEIRQIRLITIAALSIFILQNIFIALVPGNIPSYTRALAGEPFDIAILAFGYFTTGLTLYAARRGWTTVAALAMLSIFTGGSVLLNITQAFWERTSAVSLVVLLILGFISLAERGLAIAGVVAVAAFAIGLSRRDFVTPLPQTASAELLGVILTMVGVATPLYFYSVNNRAAQEERLAEADDARLRLATLSADISQRVAAKTDLNDVLSATVEEIRDKYVDIYHAQVFLIDDYGAKARLVASTGDVGALLLARGHALDVGSISVIGRVSQSGQIVVARSGSTDSVHKRNELLPETVVEAAFPLTVEGGVIGALDLQSRSELAFQDDDLPIFQSLANNIAVAIQNARLNQQTQARLRENQRLIDQMRGAMREIERLNRDLTVRSWADYLDDASGATNLDIDFTTETTSQSDVFTPALRQAITSDSTIQAQNGSATVIAIPIRVRGQVIGAMEFELERPTPIVEVAGLAQTVSERFGLALENTRLYESSQRVAQREQRVNAIALQYQNVTTIDELLRITVSELGTLLGAEKGSIRLGSLGFGERASKPEGQVAPLRLANAANGAGHSTDEANG